MDATVLDAILAPFTYGFMQRAMLVTLVAAVACALLSTWLVQMGWSLMGDAVSHSVLPGVALAYILGLPFAIGAAVFGIGAVALIGGVRAATRIKADAAIGVVFTTLFALGLVIVSVTPSDTDLQHILFGNVLGVSDGDIAQVLIVGGIVCVTLLVLRRDLTLVAFDAGHAHAHRRAVGCAAGVVGRHHGRRIARRPHGRLLARHLPGRRRRADAGARVRASVAVRAPPGSRAAAVESEATCSPQRLRTTSRPSTTTPSGSRSP